MSQNQHLEHELSHALLLRLLESAGNPELIREALADEPNEEKITDRLRSHNQRLRGTLSRRIQSAHKNGKPLNDATRAARDLFDQHG